eukprot:scaffold2101_cov363-Pavlova_lutheri.AAC.1
MLLLHFRPGEARDRRGRTALVRLPTARAGMILSSTLERLWMRGNGEACVRFRRSCAPALSHAKPITTESTPQSPWELYPVTGDPIM